MSVVLGLPGGRFALLVPPAEATGDMGLWPGRPRGLAEADIEAAAQRVAQGLDAGLEVYTRLIESRGELRRRGWRIEDAVGRLIRTEWIDPEARHYRDLLQAEWPRTPRPTTRAGRARRTAA